MKNKRIITLAVLVLLAAVLLTGCQSVVYERLGVYAEWDLSPDETVLTETARYNESYELVETFYGHYYNGDITEFKNRVTSKKGNLIVTAKTRTDEQAPDVLYLYYGATAFVYSRVGYPDELERYLSGEVEKAYISDNSSSSRGYYEVSADDLARYDSVEASLKIDVTDLKDKLVATLYACGADGSLRHEHGGFYELEAGAVYYLNYDALDNSYFDANGKFSYRRGEVDLARLSDADASAVLDSDRYTETQFARITNEAPRLTDEDIALGRRASRLTLITLLLIFLIIPTAIPFVFAVIRVCRRRTRGVDFTSYVIIGAFAAIVIIATALVLLTL